MEDMELKAIWQSYETQLAQAQLLNAQSWALTLRCFEDRQQQKAAGKLNSLAKFKTRAVILGVVWVLFLGLLVYGNRFTNPYFSTSVAAIALFSGYAVVIYIRHIILIKQLRFDGSITDTQEKLSQLQASTFQSTRIGWLQLPFYSSFFWSSSWIRVNPTSFWFISFPVTLIFVLAAIYLYIQITPGNMHKKWVRSLMMAGPEYKNVIEADAFLKEINEFRSDLL